MKYGTENVIGGLTGDIKTRRTHFSQGSFSYGEKFKFDKSEETFHKTWIKALLEKKSNTNQFFLL